MRKVPVVIGICLLFSSLKANSLCAQSGPTLLAPSLIAPETSAPIEEEPEIIITPKITIPANTTPQQSPTQWQEQSQKTNRIPRPERPATAKPTEINIIPKPKPTSKPFPQSSTENKAGGTAEAPDYWIVSSRRLPQSPAQEHRLNGQQPVLDYIRFDQDRTFRRYQESEFKTWFDPGTPVCFIVHGSFTSWESLRFESGHLYYWFKKSNPNKKMQIVFFTWPSANQLSGLLISDVERLGQRASYNARHLQHLVLNVPEKSPLTLFGHSHGARMCSQTIHDLASSTEWQSRENQAALQAIFVSAAFDHNWLQPGQRNGQTMQVVDKVLNLKNSTDFALTFYSVQGANAEESLGRVGLTPQDRLRIGNAVSKYREFDLAPLIGTSHLWSNMYHRADLGKYVSNFVVQPEEKSTAQNKPTPVPSSSPETKQAPIATPQRSTSPTIQQSKTFFPVKPMYNTNRAGFMGMRPYTAGLPFVRPRRTFPPISTPTPNRKW